MAAKITPRASAYIKMIPKFCPRKYANVKRKDLTALGTQRNIFRILLYHTEIRLYLPCTDWFGTANGCPFAVPNHSENGKNNLNLVWLNKISKIFLFVWGHSRAILYSNVVYLATGFQCNYDGIICFTIHSTIFFLSWQLLKLKISPEPQKYIFSRYIKNKI